MCRKSLVLLALFLIVALPAPGQRSEAYFSLTTTKTFLPGERIGVRLYSHGVRELEFRIYRVNDPLEFFEHLGDVHNFNSGGLGRREQIENRSPIERFHDWKLSIWFEVRDFFRAQYSAQSRSQIRESVAARQTNAPVNASIFAQVPLLNESQVVARWRQNTTSNYLSESEAVPVSSLGRGAYLMEATDGTLRAYTILIVSDIGLITKSAPGQILTYVADRRTGAPIAGATVHIWTNKQENRAAMTDANGMVEATVPTGRVDAARVIAVRGADVALTTPNNYFVSDNPNSEWTGYVYTDRPVYRPGHTVHLRAVLRTWRGDKYNVPEGQQAQVQIEDPTNKQIFQARLPVSAFGTIHSDFVLPADAALGYYGVSIDAGGARQYAVAGGFHVEEYKKPEYDVQVHIAKPHILQGDAIDATIQARYYFGEPVAGAKVTYVVHAAPYWSPFIERDDQDEAYGGGPGSGEEGDYADYEGEQLSEQSGTLDANGTLVVHLSTRIDDEHHQDMRYRVEARVTDEGNREISGAASVPATYGSFAVGISTDSYVYQAGQTLRATAVARDYDGHPVAAPVHLELLRWQFFGLRQPASVVLDAKDGQTDADGRAEATFTLSQSGSFILRVSATTPEMRQVTGTTWLWVSGSGETSWGGNQRTIRLIADKKSYKAGDTAHVLILTGVPEAYVLVASEGRTIRHQQIVHATSPSVTVDIPLGADEQPNVWISAAFLHDNQFYQSQQNLKVPAVQQQLHIDVQPAKPQFQPGEKAVYAVLVHDAAGKPVAGEFSLGIVDEAIYAIEPDIAGDIFNSFYGTVYDRVGTESSLNFYFNGEAGKRAMFLAVHGGHNSLAQLKPEPLVQPRIRKEFPDTALWLAELRTDATGRAQAELTFPDSLTTWRATVRGITADTKVGSAIERVVVRKNLMVRLAVPRFFRQGDEITISAIVGT